MQMQQSFANASRNSLNTLAQTGTKKTITKAKPQKIVKGNGTETRQTSVLANRAKRKMITQKLILSLVDVANKKGQPERAQAYWNTYHCQTRITSANGRLYGNYCKNRFCTLCSGIRKAEIINKYLPIVETWADPHFITLTVKAVPAKWLTGRIKNVLRAFRRIIDRHKKRHNRGKGILLKGIKSLECNFNPVARTYNPHLHLIVPDKATAETIIAEWLSLWTDKFASKVAQKARRVEDTTRDLIEIIKYGSKIFTDPTMKKKSKRKVSPFIYVSAFDNIICAMQSHRVFDRFGFNLPKTNKPKGGKHTIVSDYEELIFDPMLNDWINPESEQMLTGYKPSAELMAILESNIDTCLQ